MKVRYDVVTKRRGIIHTEEFTGVFDTDEDAEKWYKKHGKFWEEKGKTFIKRILDGKRNNL